jgi:aspartyl-tRNA(Asn)/glutamyl-tRNA(Gln) amidotransferase subunit A
MSYLDKSLKEIHEALKNGEVTSKELTEESLKRAHEYQDELNSFVTILDDAKEEKVTDNILSGIPCAIKDNFSTKGVLTTASSNILSDYVPVFDATAVSKLKDAGAVMIGKTVLDELAMGGTGTTGHTGIVRNPWDPKRMIGGSSAGSASAVARGIVPYALGSDTGDSIRKPAGYGGVVGYKPTYGLVSRWGLFAFASSLDHVGCFAKTVEDAAYVIDNIKGIDEKDMTSFDSSDINIVENLNNDVKGRKLFYIKEIVDNLKDDKVYYDNFLKTLDYCKELGIEVAEESIDEVVLKGIYPSYMAISCAEATSNNSNLTGIPFGNRKEGRTPDDVMINTRTEGFSELIRRRFVIGSFILQKENQEKLFKNAQRIRRLIVDKMTELFKRYDGCIMPNAGSIAPYFDEEHDRLSEKYLLLENHLAIGNFGGFPSITIPSGLVDNMPVAINITGPIMSDDVVFNIAKKLEEKIGFVPLSLKEEK